MIGCNSQGVLRLLFKWVPLTGCPKECLSSGCAFTTQRCPQKFFSFGCTFTTIQYEGVLRFFYVKTGNDSKRKKWFNIISLKEIQSLKRQNIYSLIEFFFFFLKEYALEYISSYIVSFFFPII